MMKWQSNERRPVWVTRILARYRERPIRSLLGRHSSLPCPRVTMDWSGFTLRLRWRICATRLHNLSAACLCCQAPRTQTTKQPMLFVHPCCTNSGLRRTFPAPESHTGRMPGCGLFWLCSWSMTFAFYSLDVKLFLWSGRIAFIPNCTTLPVFRRLLR